MNTLPTITLNADDGLELSRFQEMDYFVVKEYGVPVELMMENAGLHLAILTASFANAADTIQVGIGDGNNGGGGLVAARRLAAWGYHVVLDMPVKISKALPKQQLKRALKFGVQTTPADNINIWLNAYLGFSQRLPLSVAYQERVESANMTNCRKISLDIPTGFLGDPELLYFKADHVLSLAAAKNIFKNLPASVNIYLADLGIPKEVYTKFATAFPPFNKNGILKIKR